ncbi:MAG: TlyA family rRNA (cytidine-2'-O)-methyltransferase [Stappia sp.]|uniref:TlyA family RNA methyltransferase n=1 Tax=Stappia sp. TaxID=1870903 RepID=UPI000C403973|nr:TlyA family RNA methyltransferase [Stappia sp.]MAA97931.1 TlyA family rRNA (cytidine-2'-O)-methyltransferase [Stappia sp.]MBM19655.1 TlyA family rRNA (cytidine-2'-O)-methyltransferase [Stappia sp.]
MGERLDQHLVTLGHFESRARARDAVLRGVVFVDGEPADKPARKIQPGQRVEVADPAARYVSRAALKLKSGLSHFGLSARGRIALDLGASTGGFTQVLLEEEALRVHAIDVGHGQLHHSLDTDPRVVRRDGVNARALTLADLDGEHPGIVVSDMSFISLRLALPPALELAAPGAGGLFLVKPQFEAGRAAIGKGGIVDPETGERVAREVADWLDGLAGWRVLGLEPSPITGGDGNREWLLGALRDRTA